MTLLAALVLASPLAATPAAAQRPALPPTPPDTAARMNGLFTRATPAVRAFVDGEARKLRSLPPPADGAPVAADALRTFAGRTPQVTPGQADVLAAMAIYQVVSDLDSEARLAPSPEAVARLAERKAAFLRVLTALLRRLSEADAAIVANLK